MLHRDEFPFPAASNFVPATKTTISRRLASKRSGKTRDRKGEKNSPLLTAPNVSSKRSVHAFTVDTLMYDRIS